MEYTTLTEREVRHEEFAFWLSQPVTQEFRRRLLAIFDHQRALEGASLDAPLAQFVGRAEVLAFIREPHRLFEE